MKPKERIIHIIQEYLLEDLENEGFRFMENKLNFYKNFGVLKLNFDILLTKYNHGERAEFSTRWSITADSYRKWHFDEWGTYPENLSLIEMDGRDIPGWKTTGEDFFDGSESDRERGKILRDSIMEAGIPYFMEFTYWDTVAEYLLKKEQPSYSKACDCYLMYNEDTKAESALLKGLEALQCQECPDVAGEKAALNKRLLKYFR